MTGFNSREITVGLANVATLTAEAQRAAPPGPRPTVVTGGKVYDPRGAWDEAQVVGCTGTPKVCAPLWTWESVSTEVVVAAPTVVDGYAFLVNRPGPWPTAGSLAVYDATGTRNCGGSPKVCSPLWTAGSPLPASVGGVIAGSWVSPTVVDGTVYLSNNFMQTIEAYDAAGVENCSGSPKVCIPRWQGTALSGTPAVVDGVVYAISSRVIADPATYPGGLVAFDAAGIEGCTGATGTTNVCEPLWRMPIGVASQAEVITMVNTPVADGVVYAIAGTTLVAADANGVTNCGGTPKVCAPLWQADGVPVARDTVDFRTDVGYVSGALALGRLYVPVFAGVWVFDTTTPASSCSGTPTRCRPIGALRANGGADVNVSLGGVTVANGVAYLGGPQVWAFDTALEQACVTVPVVPPTVPPSTIRSCDPVWNGGNAVGYGTVVVWDGRVYAADKAYALPSS